MISTRDSLASSWPATSLKVTPVVFSMYTLALDLPTLPIPGADRGVQLPVRLQPAGQHGGHHPRDRVQPVPLPGGGAAGAGRIRGLGLDFIVKYSVFHTLAGFARLKNSSAVFQVI